MATVFVGLVLITLVVNAVITNSKTRWWRDPGSLFRSEAEPEVEPEVAPEPRSPRVRQPWEVAPRQEVEARPRPVAPRSSNREAAAVHHPATAAGETPVRSGRHAMRAPAAVPIEYAETELIPRISESGSRHDRYAAR